VKPKDIVNPTVLPHEKEMAVRLSKRNLNPNAQSDEESGRKNESFFDNIMPSLDRTIDRERVDDTHTCAICVDQYKEGDEVAWSMNKDCCHAYHGDCIVQWLMDNDDCPMCRSKYIL